jgi:hypothetical protein
MSSYVTSDQTQIHNFIIVVSTISDADEVPLTPNSKHSGGAYNVADTYAESGSPAPSCFSAPEHNNNNSSSSRRAPTLEDRRLLDRLIGRSVDDDQDLSETISPKVIKIFQNITVLIMCTTYLGQGWVFRAYRYSQRGRFPLYALLPGSGS